MGILLKGDVSITTGELYVHTWSVVPCFLLSCNPMEEDKTSVISRVQALRGMRDQNEIRVEQSQSLLKLINADSESAITYYFYLCSNDALLILVKILEAFRISCGWSSEQWNIHLLGWCRTAVIRRLLSRDELLERSCWGEVLSTRNTQNKIYIPFLESVFSRLIGTVLRSL